MWRPPGEERILLMAGRTARYSIEPRGEYVFGVVARRPMRSLRGRERRLVRPGELVAWDPSGAHGGVALDSEPWSARLMVVEIAALDAIAGDQESDLPPDVTFPEPVLSDPVLVSRFVRMHRALDRPGSRLAHEVQVAEWLREVIARGSTVRSHGVRMSGRDERALRLACDYIGDNLAENVRLDDLAAAAGIGKFRLIRLFRERIGLPPHALQVAQRVRSARRLLEAGETIAATAAATGFADQSHLHRHFQRTLGLTPGEYRRRFGIAG